MISLTHSLNSCPTCAPSLPNAAVIDQMTEGHLFLEREFGVRPTIGWHIGMWPILARRADFSYNIINPNNVCFTPLQIRSDTRPRRHRSLLRWASTVRPPHERVLAALVKPAGLGDAEGVRLRISVSLLLLED